MSKRIFRIEAGRYGGETVIGEVDAEFVDYFLAIDKSDKAPDLILKLSDSPWKEPLNEPGCDLK